MRQRMDDAVFAFTNSVLAGNSVVSVLSNSVATNVTTSASAVVVHQQAWIDLVTTVQIMAVQLAALKIVQPK